MTLLVRNFEECRRQKRQRQGGAEDAQDREDAAQHPGGLGACKGGGVDAQRAGCHLGDGDEVRQIGVRHPAVGGHFIHDEGIMEVPPKLVKPIFANAAKS